MSGETSDAPVIHVLDRYYVLGDGHLFARHLFRREGDDVKLVAIIIDEEAAERIISALSGG